MSDKGSMTPRETAWALETNLERVHHQTFVDLGVSLLRSAAQLLSQWAGFRAHVEQGPVRLKETQIADSHGFEGAFEPGDSHLSQHSLWEACGGVIAVPLEGSCDVRPHRAKGESPLWASALSGHLKEWFGPLLTNRVLLALLAKAKGSNNISKAPSCESGTISKSTDQAEVRMAVMAGLHCTWSRAVSQ